MLFINISSNYLTGTVPSSIAKLQYLRQFFIQNNILSGNLTNVFNGTLQKSLIKVQLSNNQFTGQLPNQLFLSSSLVSVAAVSNCFHGSIPSSICINNQLVSLALDGLVCASSCRKKIFAGISSSYISTYSINGGIPHCIWSMPNLQLLHMSGNSLTGTLPITLSNSIMDLSLSYNLLTGRITNNIQERSWSNLDLSHNRLSGTLVSTFNVSSKVTQSSLLLNDNRLSGFIPSSIRNLININILEGGYYDCKYDRSDLPSHDSYKDVYECGSITFNVIYFIWLGKLLITIIVLFVFWYYKDNKKVIVLIGKIIQWLNVDSYLQSLASSTDICNNLRYKLNNKMKYIKRYIAVFEMMRVMSINLTLLIMILLLPIYTILGIFYRIHTYEYAWTVAMMYLSGKVPFGIAISALIIFIFSLFLSYNTIRNKSNMMMMIMIHEENDHKQDLRDDNANSTTSRNHIWIVYLMYIIINLIIISGVNIGYVLVVLYQSRSIIILTQILFSIFKCFWISYISPLMVRWIINHLKIDNILQQSTFFFLQFVVSIFNTIIIPCLVIMVISPNCFFHAFQPESDVTTMYSFYNCDVINFNGTCVKYETQYATTSYSPPFTYSYQCGSEFIKYYAPVFVLLCILSTFIIPIIQIILIKMKLLFNPTLDNTVKKIFNIDEIYELLVCELIFIGLMITFGTIFPPLAIVLLLALSRKTYFHQIILGRFINNILSSNIHSRFDILEDNLKVQPSLSTIEKCGWFLLYTACCFYSLFLFDILGDSVGFNGAYWVLIVMPCLPLIIHVIYEWRKYFITKTIREKQSEVSVNDYNNSHTTTTIQLTSTVSMVSNPLSISSEFIRDSSMKDIDASDRRFESFKFGENSIF